MHFAVETWAPDYGTSAATGDQPPSDAQIDIAVEVLPEQWKPRDPSPATPLPVTLLFVDGVQRVDARVWVTIEAPGPVDPVGEAAIVPPPGEGMAALGVCASWAAGVVRCCPDHAEVLRAEVRRGVICPAEGMEPIVTRHGVYEPRTVTPPRPQPEGGRAPVDPIDAEIGRARGDLEARVAIEVSRDNNYDLVIVDGPLGDRRHIPGAVGYIKTHQVTYLPPPQQAVVAQLAAGQRTPLFRVGGRRFRYSWYLRLPGPGDGLEMPHGSWGIVRCEAEGELPLDEAVERADAATAALGRFATRPHQDSRAPQNLHPIAGLERDLRRRMGDTGLLERALRVAALNRPEALR